MAISAGSRRVTVVTESSSRMISNPFNDMSEP